MLTHTKFDYISDWLIRWANPLNAKIVSPARKGVASAIVGIGLLLLV